MAKRKQFSKEIKAKVAMEAIKGHRSVNEIAGEFDIHPTQVNSWKKQLLRNASALFDRGRKDREVEAIDKERCRLYEQIGRLQVEVDWLKKKTGHLD